MHTTTTRTRGSRTALVIGSAFAAPFAIVGIANAVSPTPAPTEPRDLGDLDGTAVEVVLPEADVDASQAFWDAGFQYCDAEALAAAHGTDIWEAKLTTGRAVRSGADVAPSGCVDEIDGVAAADAAALDAFLDAGYEYCDAEALAASVEADDPYETKLAIGAALVSGGDVPAPTGCTS